MHVKHKKKIGIGSGTGSVAEAANMWKTRLNKAPANSSIDDAPSPNYLTARERQILSLVRQGLRNGDIAARLSITESSVGSHLHAVSGKLGVMDRFGLAIYAWHHEL